MKSHMTQLGAFEAKTKLSELLRETEKGSSFVIVRRGKPVARLVPPDFPFDEQDKADPAEAFREIREAVAGPIDIRALIDEGRR